MEEFWALREDANWDHYNAELDGQIFTTLKQDRWLDEATGEEKIQRSHRLKAKVNPIPRALRSTLGVDEFIVRVHATWHARLYEKQHAMALQVQTPVFTDRIKINGEQWAEKVDDHNCLLKTRMTIQCKLPGPGIGTQVEKGTEKGMKDAYKDQPRRVIEYLKQRAAKGEPYPDPYAPPGPMNSYVPLAGTAGATAAAAASAADSKEDAAPTPTKQTKPLQPSAAALTPPPPYVESASSSEAFASPPPPLLSPGVGMDINAASPGGASLLVLRQALMSQRAALQAAETELMRLEAEGAAGGGEGLAEAQAMIESLQAELADERAHSAALRQRLEDSQADLREEKLRTQELGNTLANTLALLKDPKAELQQPASRPSSYAPTAFRPPNAAPSSNGGACAAVDGVSSARAASAAPAMAPTLRQPTAEDMTLMGDTYDSDDDGDSGVGSTTIGSTASAFSLSSAATGGAPRPPPAPPPGPPPPRPPSGPSPASPTATAPAATTPSPAPPTYATPPPTAAESPLVHVLHTVAGGQYAGEALVSHVGLGNSLLLCTPSRFVYVKKVTWDLLWTVEYAQVLEAEMLEAKSQVRLSLGPGSAASSLTVDCMTPAVVPLVHDTMRQAIGTSTSRWLGTS